jgi:hypothetical protein
MGEFDVRHGIANAGPLKNMPHGIASAGPSQTSILPLISLLNLFIYFLYKLIFIGWNFYNLKNYNVYFIIIK